MKKRVVIIGGTGHVGTYLVPRLVESGYEVICISRQVSKPYHGNEAWKMVKQVVIDRKAADAKHEFGGRVLELDPDIVIDMICFTLESAKDLVEALVGKVQCFLHCGTIWVHGYSEQVPTREDQIRRPFGSYGINKAAIEAYLISEARAGFPATILHPGHIVGPGWHPVNPAGNLNPEVFESLQSGKELFLPNLGMETLHHVHADDVALAFCRALQNWPGAAGQSFHIVSEQALTLRGYAESIATWFGQEPNLQFLPWEQWKKTVGQRDAELTWDHIAHSPNCSIEKASDLLNYRPRYTSLQAVQESLTFFREQR
jgi:nucleoside-diphosphate-sugar epimerase